MPLLDYLNVPRAMSLKRAESITAASPLERKEDLIMTTRYLTEEECEKLNVMKGSLISFPAHGGPFPLAPRHNRAASEKPDITRADRILLGMFPEDNNYAIPLGTQFLCPLQTIKKNKHSLRTGLWSPARHYALSCAKLEGSATFSQNTFCEFISRLSWQGLMLDDTRIVNAYPVP
jgi:hypothetical protein